MYSLVIPVYNNERNIPSLLSALEVIESYFKGRLEVIFVIDGSPDRSADLLEKMLPDCKFSSKLLNHSRNFGSFIAIKNGLAAAKGEYFSVMAADLQEPPEVVVSFFKELEKNEVDVVIGQRESRDDSFFSGLSANIFWFFYRKLIQKDVPPGGVDIFGCNRNFCKHLLSFNEANTSLIGLIFWLGFKRKFISYTRQQRLVGKSGWTLKKKIKYLSDSVFAFSDLPIRVLMSVGLVGLATSAILGILIFLFKILGLITVPGYTALAVMFLFFAGLNCLGFGILGGYIWRAFENTKARPNGVVMSVKEFH